MALNVNALLRDYKSAGIYTIEVDNTQRTIDENQSLRLLVGFNGKGPFNRPVYLETDLDRQRIFGDIDTRLEHKGCFFNRMAQTMLQAGPIFTLNLLNVDNTLDSKDKVNFSAMSLNSVVPNPKVLKTYSGNGKYTSVFTEFDYLKDLVDQYFYVFDEDETSIPYVGAVNFAELYDRSKFWIPSPENLNIHAAQALTSNNNVTEPYNSNFLNFANVGTEEFSILVFKPENLKGFDVTAAEWYGGKENIPYGFIRPYDYISDYFLQVICVKGNWTNYADLHTDPIWKSYFEEKGIIKGKINNFLAAEGITLLGSWTGIIIPDFVDKQGIPQNLIDKINKNIETTGLMASFNIDAAISLNYDYNGPDTEEGEYGEGCWFLDIDENGSYDIENGETGNIEFLVDMVGHNMQNPDIKKNSARILLKGNPIGTSVETDQGDAFKFSNEYDPDFRYIILGDQEYVLIEELAQRGIFQWGQYIEQSGNSEPDPNNSIYFSTPDSILTYRPVTLTGIKQATLNRWIESGFPFTSDDLSNVNDLKWYPLNNWKKGGSYEGEWAVKLPNENEENGFSLYKIVFTIKPNVKSRSNINNMDITSISELSTFYYYNEEKGTLHSFNVFFEGEDSSVDPPQPPVPDVPSVTLDAASVFIPKDDTGSGRAVVVFNGLTIEHVTSASWVDLDLSTDGTSEVLVRVPGDIDWSMGSPLVFGDGDASTAASHSGISVDDTSPVSHSDGYSLTEFDDTFIANPTEIWYEQDEETGVWFLHSANGRIPITPARPEDGGIIDSGDGTSSDPADPSDPVDPSDDGQQSKISAVHTIIEIVPQNGYDVRSFTATYQTSTDLSPVTMKPFAYKADINSNRWHIYSPTGLIGDFYNPVLSVQVSRRVKNDSNNSSVPTINYSNLSNSVIVQTSEQKLYNCQFLSYNYMSEEKEGTDWYGLYTSNPREVITEVADVMYFFDPSCGLDGEGNAPVNRSTKSVFICTDKYESEKILVGDYVNNYTANSDHKTYETNIIPGVTKVTSKLFITVERGVNGYEFTYKGKKYTGYTGNVIDTSKSNYANTWGKLGFYVYTTTESVDITNGQIIRQLPLSSPEISYCLKFIPMKGLKISTRHKPGYDKEGKMNVEGGIEKIYSVLADQGIERGLCNPEMVDYRYIVDSMSHGISSELGGKRYLSELAKKRGKTTAILNMPSKKEFAASVNPYFNDSYIMGYNVKPAFDTKYIPQGGNMELYSTSVFTLPDEESGSKFTACFWPNLTYNVNGKNISVPPAADVANTFIRKFNGGNPYVINANLNGLIQNPFVVGIEYDADTTDRDYLEPFGVNTIIRKGGQIMIYGNRTAYQKVKSDLNYLHVREILNTIEINCERILYRYNFAYNTAVLRAAVVTALTPILQEVQEAGAIDSYTIVCDETNNTPEVIAEAMGIVDINVWFNMGMEKIIQRITINRSFTTNNE